jgi:CheY-like chemotaxis protein
MTDNERKMLEALVLHIDHKIDEIAATSSSAISQILIEEMRVSYAKLKALLLIGQGVDVPPPPLHQVTSPQARPVQVPVMPAAPAPALAPLSASAPAPEAPVLLSSVPKAPSEKKVLFLIDDDKDAQKVLLYMFEKKSPFQVVSHVDPIKALEAIKTHPPDLILMDLMMPGMNGLDLLKNVRQSPELRHVKILIGSSKSFDKDRIEVLKAGANDFIAKPYNFTELLLRLNKLAG